MLIVWSSFSRMHDAYVLARRVADLMRQVVPAKVIDELLNEPEAMSYYVASNLPLQDSSRCALKISFGRSFSNTFIQCEAELFGFFLYLLVMSQQQPRSYPASFGLEV
jgi:hypothetical protein